MTFLRTLVVLGLIQFTGLAALAQSGGLVVYRDAVLAEHAINDGDSFFVKAGEETYHLRLYFADCPEDAITQDHDARRVQEQARYFGLEEPERIIWLGHQAADFTKEVLSQPFTVYTSHARALGGVGSHRIYAFVVTSTGRDLGELLVENGLARNFGVKRERYDGMPAAEAEMRLRDYEISAMLARRGVWSESNPSLIVEYRARQREEKDEMKSLMTSAVRLLEKPLNINTATQKELERVPGIGPVTASRIINHRPYTNIEDLKSVPGISDKTLENIRPYIILNEPLATNG